MDDLRGNLRTSGHPDSRDDIEFTPLPSDDNSSPEGSLSNQQDEALEYLQGPGDSITPLTVEDIDKMSQITPKNAFKDHLSFALSVFNLMNAILGSGILGLAEAVKNLGIFLFVALLLGTALLASYTINMLLNMSRFTGIKTYEGIAQLAFGIRGKVATSIMIILHCLGAICSYIFIIKTELPEVIKAFLGFHGTKDEALPLYLNGDFLAIIVVLVIIVPLSAMKDIKFLGYSSAFGMFCMGFFALTVIVKKFSIPCPLPEFENATNLSNPANHTGAHNFDPFEEDDEQECEAKVVTINSRTAYALPTMMFSFMCHASMLPIYAELRRPSVGRMQKVAFVSIFNVYTLYVVSALFGYLTFYNEVQSELLLTYSLYNPSDGMIIVSRMMVIVCVTLSIPLIHYPGRKTIILTLLKDPHIFSWFRHITVMIIDLAVCVGFVMFVPNIRDIFGMAGATTSTCLLLVFPSAFFWKLTGPVAKLEIRQQYKTRRTIAIFLAIIGCIFMAISITLIIVDWVS